MLKNGKEILPFINFCRTNSYIVKTENSEFEAEITGNLRFLAKNLKDFSTVSDKVALTSNDYCFTIIHKVFPRFSVFKRQSFDQFGEIQIITANIDCVFLAQTVDRDFNINRLERYLTIYYSAKVSPIIVLTKTNLITGQQLSEIMESTVKSNNNTPVIASS